MAEKRANKPTSDNAGGVFLDNSILERLRLTSDQPQFAASWLLALSRLIDGLQQAILVTASPGSNRFDPLAVWPEGAKPKPALMQSVENCLRAGRSMMTLSQDQAEGASIAVPITVGGQIRGVVAAIVDLQPEDKLRLVIDQLQWSSGWIETLVRRGRISDNDGLSTVVELLATSLHHRRFEEAATATATELATFLNCERAAIGFHRGRHVKLRALSHSANFGKQSNAVKAIQHAMDEAVDQQATIVTPQPDDAPERATLKHEELMRGQDMAAICTVPITEGRRAIGALMLERAEPFDRATVQLIEHAAALLGPTLDVKRREDRWLPAKAWDAAGNTLKALVGPRHAALKLAVILLAAASVFFWYAKGEYRVTADAVVEGRIQRTIAAPVSGYLSDSGARAGDAVTEGQVIASLDVTDLRLEKLKWSSQKAKQKREYSEALARKERARARILDAQIEQADAQLALIDQQIARMRITAPFTGLIVSGDLSQALGSPVERGDVLFEIAPLNDYRVMLRVDERDIGDMEVGQIGALALASMPQERIPFEIARVTPVSNAADGLNFFFVEGSLDSEKAALLRPGMEGVGKVFISERPLIWIWTRKTINWMRMFAWSWTP
jgi:multidrug resistance efflux pump